MAAQGQAVPYIPHLIAVSDLVHDAIEDAGQSHDSIAERFGVAVVSRFADEFRYSRVRVLEHQGIVGTEGKAAEGLGLPDSRRHRPQC